MTEDRYDWRAIQERWLPVWDKLDPFRAGQRGPDAQRKYVLDMFPYPSRRPAHGPRRGVRHRRRASRATGSSGASTCCTRSAGTPSACRPRTRRSSATRTRRSRRTPTSRRRRSRSAATRSPSTGRGGCTPATRSTTAGPSGCSCSCIERGPGLPQGLAGQLVPEGPDRAGQRAGRRRRLRALRHPGRQARADPVVLPDHRLRRPAAGRHGAAGGRAGRSAC